jgi:hypothetical protein
MDGEMLAIAGLLAERLHVLEVAALETASDALFRDEQDWRPEWGSYPEPLRQAHTLIAREIARRKGR